MNAEARQKVITFSQITEDKQNITAVTKRFNYQVSLAEEPAPEMERPEVFINKYFDKNESVEKFEFKVRGYFYASKDNLLVRIDFEHDLNIEIYWKQKVFSPKKSVVLTE